MKILRTAGVAALLAVGAPAIASAGEVTVRVVTVDGNPIPAPGLVATLTAPDGTVSRVSPNGTIDGTRIDAPDGTQVHVQVTGQAAADGQFVRESDCPLPDAQITRGTATATVTASPQTLSVTMPQTVGMYTDPAVDVAEAEVLARLNAARTAAGQPPLASAAVAARVADAQATYAAAVGSATAAGQNCSSFTARAFELGAFAVTTYGHYGRDSDSGPDVAADALIHATAASLRSPLYTAAGVAYAGGFWYVTFATAEMRELHGLPARPLSGSAPAPGDDASDATRALRITAPSTATSGRTVTLRGTAPAGETVTLMLKARRGATVRRQVTADATGRWTWRRALTYSATLTARTGAGTVSRSIAVRPAVRVRTARVKGGRMRVRGTIRPAMVSRVKVRAGGQSRTVRVRRGAFSVTVRRSERVTVRVAARKGYWAGVSITRR